MFDKIMFLLLTGGIAYAYFKGKDAAKSEHDTSGDVIDDAKKEIIQKDIIHTESWFSHSADSIQSNLTIAYKSRLPFLGQEGNNAIKEVLVRLTALKNKSEWLKLVAKFGKRSGWGGGPIWNEPLTKWLVFFLEDKSFYMKRDGKDLKANALTMAKTILKKRGVYL